MPLLSDKIIYNIRNGVYNYIGSGSSRRVFDLNNGYVIKVAKNRAGIEQNKAEYRISKSDNLYIFAKVIYASDSYEYIIMRKAKKISSINYVWKYFGVWSKHDFYNLEVIRMIQDRYNLIVNDLSRVSSWGIIDGRLQIIDYGFTRKVMNRYY